MVNSLNINLCLIDHHKSALFLNKYPWATVKINGNIEQTCATELLFYRLKDKIDNSLINNISNYVEKVKRYDTFLWDKYNDNDAVNLEILFDSIGGQGYYELLSKYKYDIYKMFEDNKWMMNCFIRKKEEFIETKLNEKIFTKNLHVLNNTYSAGIVYASRYISLLGYELINLYDDLDVIVIIDGNKMSFRTNKDYVDCQLIAKNYNNGGGHKKASGTSIPSKEQYNYFNKILK